MHQALLSLLEFPLEGWEMHPKPQGPSWKRGRKDWKWSWRVEGKSVFWKGQDHCTQELRAPVFTCTKLVQIQPGNILSWEGGAHEPHPELKSYGQLVASERGLAVFL